MEKTFGYLACSNMFNAFFGFNLQIFWWPRDRVASPWGENPQMTSRRRTAATTATPVTIFVKKTSSQQTLRQKSLQSCTFLLRPGIPTTRYVPICFQEKHQIPFEGHQSDLNFGHPDDGLKRLRCWTKLLAWIENEAAQDVPLES